MTPVRLGLVGVGAHGERYARHIANDVAEAELRALCRRDAEAGARAASEWDVAFEPTVEAMVARPDVDAVVVVTPPAHHLVACRVALRAKKPILVEKPMVATLAEALELRRLVGAAGVPLMLAQTLRYDAVLIEVQRRLEELGAIVQVRLAQRLEPSPAAWQHAHNAAGAGSILLTGVHLFDTAAWLFGDRIDTVYCVARQVENLYNEDFFAASVTLASTGIHADLEISKYTQSRSCRIEVVGERGQLLGDYWNHRLFWEAGREQVELPLGPRVFTVEATVRDFCRRLIGGEPMPITAADGVQTLAAVDACYRSVAAGGPVRAALPA